MSIAANRLDAAFMKAYRSSALTSQGGCCKYCLQPLSRRAATVDHRFPRSKGGTDNKANLAAACYPCNVAKGSRSEAQFLAAIKGNGSVDTNLLLVRFRRRMWTATHASCRRIMTAVGGSYAGPKRTA